MTTMFLTIAEITALTGHRRRDAQARELRHLGIDHQERRDGSLVVLRAHAEKVLGWVPEKAVKVDNTEPNWSGVH